MEHKAEYSPFTRGKIQGRAPLEAHTHMHGQAAVITPVVWMAVPDRQITMAGL
ncbi:MAG: hypothetical protein MI747_03885 [Desulfobacterales bacterium]|nr:hypothetical protein [Desulfobacterales bacterium]